MNAGNLGKMGKAMVGMPFAAAALALYAAVLLIAGTVTPLGRAAWWNGWALLFAGAGVILLAGAPVALAAGGRKVVVGMAAAGSAAFVFGLALFAYPWLWTVVLVALGIALLVASILGLAFATWIHRTGRLPFRRMDRMAAHCMERMAAFRAGAEDGPPCC